MITTPTYFGTTQHTNTYAARNAVQRNPNKNSNNVIWMNGHQPQAKY
jgi:hypothetical protein